jgi:aspartate aminotransferase/aminotransferase
MGASKKPAAERISQRAQAIQASGIRRMFELSSTMVDPINLSIGQAHFDPPEELVEAAIQALRSGHHRYSVTEGLPKLNLAIASYFERQWGRKPASTMVTLGVSGGIVLSFLAALDPGDEVLIPDPYFVMYKHVATMLGITAVTYDLYPDFRLRRAALERAVTPRTKAILVNSPANPTGAVLSREELELVAAFAEEHDLLVISDEIYSEFCFDGPFPSMIQAEPDALVLGGFSKTYGIPGWRLGYAVGPEAIIDKMRTLQQFTFVCAPVPLQHAAVKALDLDMSPEIRAYAAKRDLVVEGLRDQFELVAPAGSFYAFPRLPAGVDPVLFAERAVARKTLIVPGSAFSLRNTHFRLSFALDDAKLRRGIDVLNEIARELGARRA